MGRSVENEYRAPPGALEMGPAQDGHAVHGHDEYKGGGARSAASLSPILHGEQGASPSGGDLWAAVTDDGMPDGPCDVDNVARPGHCLTQNDAAVVRGGCGVVAPSARADGGPAAVHEDVPTQMVGDMGITSGGVACDQVRDERCEGLGNVGTPPYGHSEDREGQSVFADDDPSHAQLDKADVSGVSFTGAGDPNGTKEAKEPMKCMGGPPQPREEQGMPRDGAEVPDAGTNADGAVAAALAVDEGRGGTPSKGHPVQETGDRVSNVGDLRVDVVQSFHRHVTAMCSPDNPWRADGPLTAFGNVAGDVFQSWSPSQGMNADLHQNSGQWANSDPSSPSWACRVGMVGPGGCPDSPMLYGGYEQREFGMSGSRSLQDAGLGSGPGLPMLHGESSVPSTPRARGMVRSYPSQGEYPGDTPDVRGRASRRYGRLSPSCSPVMDVNRPRPRSQYVSGVRETVYCGTPFPPQPRHSPLRVQPREKQGLVAASCQVAQPGPASSGMATMGKHDGDAPSVYDEAARDLASFPLSSGRHEVCFTHDRSQHRGPDRLEGSRDGAGGDPEAGLRGASDDRPDGVGELTSDQSTATSVSLSGAVTAVALHSVERNVGDGVRSLPASPAHASVAGASYRFGLAAQPGGWRNRFGTGSGVRAVGARSETPVMDPEPILPGGGGISDVHGGQQQQQQQPQPQHLQRRRSRQPPLQAQQQRLGSQLPSSQHGGEGSQSPWHQHQRQHQHIQPQQHVHLRDQRDHHCQYGRLQQQQQQQQQHKHSQKQHHRRHHHRHQQQQQLQPQQQQQHHHYRHHHQQSRRSSGQQHQSLPPYRPSQRRSDHEQVHYSPFSQYQQGQPWDMEQHHHRGSWGDGSVKDMGVNDRGVGVPNGKTGGVNGALAVVPTSRRKRRRNPAPTATVPVQCFHCRRTTTRMRRSLPPLARDYVHRKFDERPVGAAICNPCYRYVVVLAERDGMCACACVLVSEVIRRVVVCAWL